MSGKWLYSRKLIVTLLLSMAIIAMLLHLLSFGHNNVAFLSSRISSMVIYHVKRAYYESPACERQSDHHTTTSAAPTTEKPAVLQGSIKLLSILANFEANTRCGAACGISILDPRILRHCFDERFATNSTCERLLGSGEINESAPLLFGVKSADCDTSCVEQALQHRISNRTEAFPDLMTAFLLLHIELKPNYVLITPNVNHTGTKMPSRALLSLETVGNKSIKLEPLKRSKFSIPANLTEFQWNWRRSTFMSCTASGQTVRDAKLKIGIPETQFSDAVVLELVYVRDILLRHRITSLLTFGTLLGWYRDCGYIDRDNDMDLSIFWHEAKDTSLTDIFFEDERTPLFLSMEMVGHPFEVKLRANKTIPIDLFYTYPSANDSLMMETIDILRRGGGADKIRWTFPNGFGGICAVDFVGHLFWAPCNVLEIIQATYGPDWATPSKSKGHWWKQNPNANISGVLTNEEADELHSFCRSGTCPGGRTKTARPRVNSNHYPMLT